ncbi:ISEc14 transposase B [Citrobacter youngae]|nr:ISEc14 transposase B [Citrobacter youngae]
MRLWLSQNPSGSAGQRATVRSEQSLATDETCRDKGSGRIPEPAARKGEASIVSPNRLQRQFNPDAPDERWVTDITYIRTHEGWLYLAVVVDLFSRKIIGWSMQSRMTKDIVLNALLMAVWRRNPQKQVLVHSDQGSQYTSHEWQSFLKSHGLEGSMSRRR